MTTTQITQRIQKQHNAWWILINVIAKKEVFTLNRLIKFTYYTHQRCYQICKFFIEQGKLEEISQGVYKIIQIDSSLK